jgi:DNA-binding transcriptional regulator GbsR (MarR family)
LDPGPEAAAQRLADLEERFVLHWGEMANAWGINRTMGQIHALLYVSPRPLSMDEVMERLKISRGNASMNLRALEDWGVIQRAHFTGDRREYFRSVSDVWELFATLIRERKRREFDPTVRSLREIVTEANGAGGDDPGLVNFRARIGSLLTLMELLESLGERLLPRDPREIPRLLEGQVEDR